MENFEFSKRFFEKEFSEARMKPYFERYRGNERMAIDLYEKNIRLSESLLPSISVFEVAVRNAKRIDRFDCVVRENHNQH